MAGGRGLNQGIGEFFQRASRFVRDELWEAEPEPRTAAARALAVLQFTVMIAQGFVRDQLLLRASALTYFTVLSIVPLLAITIAIATAVGVTGNFAEMVVDRLLAGSPDAKAKILGFVAEANFAALGTIGAATLFLTTVFGISNIESSFNEIWGVKQVRTWGRRLPDYLAVLVIAPILAGVALSLVTTFRSQAGIERLLEIPGSTLLYAYGLKQVPAVIRSLAFTVLIWFLPNTRVRPPAAILGGFVAGFLVIAAQNLYLGASVGVARANALYGSFAQIPLLFVWLYFFWAIVLFGAEVAFAYQNLDLYRREVRGQQPSPAAREAIALCITLEVARTFRDTRPGWNADGLADELKVPVRTVRDVVSRLEHDGILSERREGDEHEGYQLGRPAEKVLVTDVIGCMRGGRTRIEADSAVAQPVESLLSELAAGEVQSAAGKTIADLLVDVPQRRPGDAPVDQLAAEG